MRRGKKVNPRGAALGKRCIRASVYVVLEDWEKVQRLARERGTTGADVLRDAMRQYIEYCTAGETR